PFVAAACGKAFGRGAWQPRRRQIGADLIGQTRTHIGACHIIPDSVLLHPGYDYFNLRLLGIQSYDRALGILAGYYPLDKFPQKTLYVLEELLAGD
ncbi:MAG TPA: hypothetical protein VJ417_00490, partial [Candidatus Glassbacteria bacterium]|nr:hypothetical protein [Candidatus Glassbacteria bacterium]